jgi:hypothetical protein
VTPDFPSVEFSLTHFPPVDLGFHYRFPTLIIRGSPDLFAFDRYRFVNWSASVFWKKKIALWEFLQNNEVGEGIRDGRVRERTDAEDICYRVWPV